MRKVTARLLAKLGYEVHSAPDARVAMELVLERGTDVDLVLTDIVMPGLTGIEMVDILKQSRPDLKFLFMSGYASRELGRELSSPPEPFLPKPFSLDQLSEAVENALTGDPPD